MIDPRAARLAQMIARNVVARRGYEDGGSPTADDFASNDIGGPSPQSLIDAQPTPQRNWFDDALSKAQEYTMPRMEDYRRGAEGPAALTQAGIENMKSGDWRRMLLGAGQDVLGTVSTPFAPIAGAVEAARGSAERTFGPAAGHAVDVASMVNPDVLPLTIGKAGTLVGHYGPELAMGANRISVPKSETSLDFALRQYEPEGYLADDNLIRKQNFENFMEGTSVPQRVYHASKQNFENFNTEMSEFGSHFGTIDQANDISKSDLYPDFFVSKHSKTQTYPAYINIKNPLRLFDNGIFNPDTVARQLIDKGIMSWGDYDEIMKLPKNEASKSLQEVVKNNGYDGVVYLNRREGIKGLKPEDFNMTDKQFAKTYPDARDSYIIFDPTQVKSAIGNRGTYDPKSPKLNEANGGSISFGPDAAQSAVKLAKQQAGRR